MLMNVSSCMEEFAPGQVARMMNLWEKFQAGMRVVAVLKSGVYLKYLYCMVFYGSFVWVVDVYNVE